MTNFIIIFSLLAIETPLKDQFIYDFKKILYYFFFVKFANQTKAALNLSIILNEWFPLNQKNKQVHNTICKFNYSQVSHSSSVLFCLWIYI